MYLLILYSTEKTQKEFSEAFVEFVKILRKQAMIPVDIDDMSTRKYYRYIITIMCLTYYIIDDIDTFRSFRATLSDSLLDAYKVINKTTLDILIGGLQMQLNFDKNDWRAIESYLFCIWSVSELAAVQSVSIAIIFLAKLGKHFLIRT